MSESQERMMAVVEPGHVDDFLAVCAKWEVDAHVVGEVTTVSAQERARGGRLVVEWHGDTVVDVPPRTVAHEGPVYERPYEQPADQDTLRADAAERLPRPTGGAELRDTVLRLAAAPNLADRSWVTDQYDRYVRGNTVLARPADAGVVRVDEDSGLGVAVATVGSGRFCRLDPYVGAQLSLAAAYRSVAVVGAQPLAVSDCLNFGSPEDPAVMWQFAEAVRGLADGCRELGVPVTGGNVSFYNQTGATAILPTPVVGVLGVLADVERRVAMGFGQSGHPVYLLGQTDEELSGSEWAHVVHGHLGGAPPRVGLAAERALAELLRLVADDRLVSSAHALSGGGLAQVLVESCLRHGVGVRVRLPDSVDPFVALFSESAARAVVTVSPDAESRFTDRCVEQRVPHVRLGETDDGGALDVAGLFRLPLADLRAGWEATIPAAMS